MPRLALALVVILAGNTSVAARAQFGRPRKHYLGQARVTTVEVVSGVTGGGRLRDVTRDHWGIENGRHHTGDETFREGRCRVRRGNAPRVLASLRNAAVDLLRNLALPENRRSR